MMHRLCVQGPDEISIFFAVECHIDEFRQKAEDAGKPLAVTINIGLDPAIMTVISFGAPTSPPGFDELPIGGGLRGNLVSLVTALTLDQKSIAHAEIVVEGEILPGVRVAEDQNTKTGQPARFPLFMYLPTKSHEKYISWLFIINSMYG